MLDTLALIPPKYDGGAPSQPKSRVRMHTQVPLLHFSFGELLVWVY